MVRIMDTYEKKYKEALERAKKLQETCDSTAVVGWCEYLFPELKESEDERIRKAILNYLTKMWGNSQDDVCGVHVEDAIAWLEKQEGCEYIKKDWLEHIKQSWYKEGFIDGKYNGGTSKEWTINDAATLKELIDFLENGTAKLQHDLTRYANWLKIQFTPIEKQGEQKPSTEVKPKFHEGDWIVDNIGVAHQIEKTVLNVANNTFGYDIVGGGYFNDDSNVHLWTIQDANDGDVLVASDDSIFIYAGSTDRHAQFYIALSKYGGFNTKGGNWEDKNRIKPATKEQRDTLIKAMTDAGYTFDFEKKELKKISQRMVSAEAKEALYDKPAWSEDDEKRLQSCINILKAKSLMGKVDTANTMWLKSLKQRIGG